MNYSVPSTWTWSLCRPLLFHRVWILQHVKILCIPFIWLRDSHSLYWCCKMPQQYTSWPQDCPLFCRHSWLTALVYPQHILKQNIVEKSDKRTIPYGWMVYHWIQKVQGDTGKSVDSSGWIMILYQKNRTISWSRRINSYLILKCSSFKTTIFHASELYVYKKYCS